jgi:hypothetical protein
MRSRPRRRAKTPQGEGREFEGRFAELFDCEPQKGSGSLWYAKLDVNDGQILWTLKYSERGRLKFDNYDVNDDLMREAQAAINGQGGVGSNTMPGVATQDVDGNVFVVLRAEDFARIVTDDITYVRPPRSEIKRARASTPLLLRDD